MPTLLFDLTATQPLRHGAHGGGEYAKTVFGAIAKTRPRDVAAYWHSDRPFEGLISEIANTAGVSLHPIGSSRELQRLVNKIRPSRFYSALPYQLGSIDFGETEVFFTIHGIRPIEMPTDEMAVHYAASLSECAKALVRHYGRSLYVARLRARFENLLRVRAKTQVIIVPSDYTRRSLLKTFPSLSDDRVRVLYSPPTAVCEVPPALHKLDQFVENNRRRYILIVSGDRWVKNSYRALRAIEQLYSRIDKDLRWPVIVTGSRPARFPTRWANQFRFVGNCSREALAGYYANAGLLLYPSLNEGFGYPPIEAMSYGTPVLAGAITAVPEISAEGAAFFCPQSTEDMQIRVWSFLGDAVYRETLAKQAIARYQVVKERQLRDLQSLCNMLLQ